MLSKITLLAASANASAWTYDYASNGSDWAAIENGVEVNYCAEPNQSPIALYSRAASGNAFQ
jgi:hypothetical protein|tara:strand:- start:603 stop:788 length:186 start_codon:yes stop_codon:yes gene_type:complete